MLDHRAVRRLIQGASAVCAILALSACASGSGMFVAGADSGPGGLQDEQQSDQTDEGAAPAAETSTQNSVLAVSGNSLLPAPGLQQASDPMTPAPPSTQAALTAGLAGRTALINASLGGNAAGLLGSAPTATVGALGQTLASVSGGSATALGVTPVAGAATTLVSSVTNTALAVTTGVLGTTLSPLASMTPGATPLSTAVALLTRPGP